jgi:signal transduction histidine kinase
MIYRRAFISITVRIIMIVLTLWAMVYAWMGNRDPLILLNLLLLLALQVYLFIRSQNQVNRKLTAFFEAFRFDDLGFTPGNGFSDRSFRDLYRAMGEILDKGKQMNLENQRQKKYFQAVTEHAGVGILACNENLEVRLINKTLKDLLRISELPELAELDRLQEGFSGELSGMKPGDQKLIRLSLQDPAEITGETQMQISVKCTGIKLDEEQIRLLTFHNIREELEEKEMESWQKVIRVLTHEITNSAGPIASAAQTLLELMEQEVSGQNGQPGIINGLREDLLEGLRIIRERSTGIEEFVQEFRKVTLIPEPGIEEIPVRELFQSASVLFEKRMKEEGSAFNCSLEDPDLLLFADRNLVEQVLINLISNAIDALCSSPVKSIRLEAGSIPHRQCVISITDTGQGIGKEELDKIFVPFYTTREDGSGIGLSLARNIMRMHRGSIQVHSDPGRQTTFRMIF